MEYYKYLNPFKSKNKNQFTAAGFGRLFMTSILLYFSSTDIWDDINLTQVGLFGAIFMYFSFTWIIAGDDNE
jgi:hypothetical protein